MVWRFFCLQTLNHMNGRPLKMIGEGCSSTYPAPTYKYCACRSNLPNFTLAWALHPMSVRSPVSSSEKAEVIQMQAAFPRCFSAHVTRTEHHRGTLLKGSIRLLSVLLSGFYCPSNIRS